MASNHTIEATLRYLLDVAELNAQRSQALRASYLESSNDDGFQGNEMLMNDLKVWFEDSANQTEAIARLQHQVMGIGG